MIGKAVLVRHEHHLSLAAINRSHDDGSCDLKEFVRDLAGGLVVRETLGVREGPDIGQWIMAPWQERLERDREERTVVHHVLELEDLVEPEPGPLPAPPPAPAVAAPMTYAPWVVIEW